MVQNILICRTTLKYLKYQVVWPQQRHELNPGKTFYIQFALLITSTGMLLFGSVFHFIVSYRAHTDVNLTQDIAYIISYLGILFFISCHISTIRNTAHLYKDISDFTTFGKPKNFEQFNKKMNNYSELFNITITLICIGVSLTPLLEKGQCEKDNLEKGLHEVCGLQAPTWLPFEFDYFPAKQLYYLLQMYSSMMTMKSAAYISYGILEAEKHVQLRVSDVKRLFREAIMEKKEGTRRRKFNKCIRYHNVVLSYVERLDVSYKNGSCVHIILTGAVIGCLGFQLVERASVSNLCILSGWFMSMAFVCIGGQHIMDECDSIADTVYNTSWYKTDLQLQKDILFVMMRSRKPVYLHGGPFANLTYSLILGVMKSSYSYLTLLIQTTN